MKQVCIETAISNWLLFIPCLFKTNMIKVLSLVCGLGGFALLVTRELSAAGTAAEVARQMVIGAVSNGMALKRLLQHEPGVEVRL